MADFSSVFFSTITEINAKLARQGILLRRVDSRLLRPSGDALARRYNALALSLRKQAIKQASEVDDDLKRDRTRGPLQGIPYGAKDLLAVKGKPTTWGARPFAGQVFDEDAEVIQKLNKTGAILIGKLAMVELAGGGDYRFASASLTGPGLNPWDRTRWSGGSSSGSAAAVAAGLVTFALGSETSGSIVTPGRVLRRHRTAAHLWHGQPPRRDGRFPGRSIRSGRSAARRKIARWCCMSIAGSDHGRSGIGGTKLQLQSAICAQALRSHHRLRAGRFQRMGGPGHAAGPSGSFARGEGSGIPDQGSRASGIPLRRHSGDDHCRRGWLRL